jgi:hypothetical protein
MAASFTPLQPTLGIAHGDLRLVWSCSAMETNFMKILTNSYCANVPSRDSLELCSECCNRGQTMFMHYKMVYHNLQFWNNGKVVLLWMLINLKLHFWENGTWILWYTYWRALLCRHLFSIVHTLWSLSPTHLFEDSHVLNRVSNVV